jgi:hypothetical protein
VLVKHSGSAEDVVRMRVVFGREKIVEVAFFAMCGQRVVRRSGWACSRAEWDVVHRVVWYVGWRVPGRIQNKRLVERRKSEMRAEVGGGDEIVFDIERRRRVVVRRRRS